VLTLFSRSDDPHCHWVRIVVAEKALAVRVVDVDPSRPPEDLIDLNPYQSVPTLVDRDLVVYEPRVIGEYLDERYPHPPMLPNDPGNRAQARVAMHRIERDWYGCAQLMARSEGRESQKLRRLMLESILASEPLFRIKPWFLSDHFSLLDAAVAPILWRLPEWKIELPATAQSILRYGEQVFARPSVRQSMSETEREMRV
jgi:RNA polymerase-associated protein